MSKINIIIIFLLSAILLSCNGKVEVSVFNNSEVDRNEELVELCLCQLTGFDYSRIVVFDEKGNQVPYQLLYKGSEKPQCLIFPVTLAAGEKTSFFIKEGEPASVDAKTFVRYVPERKDDIAWENDRIAFRMYGPALAAENPSNGVDVWYKRTSDLIIDKWYKDELSGKATYHEDHGEGLDCYKVAHTLGAGSIAPFMRDSLFVGSHYDRYKILDNGPLQSSFVLFYDRIPVGKRVLKAEMMIKINAGSNFNEATIKYTGDTTGFMLAAGIYLHDSIQSVSKSLEKRYIAYSENLMSQTSQPVFSGRGHTAVIFPAGITEFKMKSGHILGLSKYKTGDEYRYFFGSGWSKAGFKTDQEWCRYVESESISIMQPLSVKLYK